MTPKISLITAILGAALVFAVPAFGDNWGADRQDQAVRVSPDVVDLLTAKNGVVDSSVVDALSTTVPIRGERFVPGASSEPVTTVVRGERFIPGAAPVAPAIGGERFIEGAPSDPVTTPSSTGSGTELDWPQIGIGFGMGLLLALGLYLAMKTTRHRPLAH